MALIIGSRAWIAIHHPKPQRIVEKEGNPACGRRDGFLFSNTPCQPPVECAKCSVAAANRSNAAALLDDRRVREESTLPPEILFPGARQSHDVKCLAVGQARRSVPHAPMSFSARDEPRPWICVRSVPTRPYRAARTSNDGAFTCLVLSGHLAMARAGPRPQLTSHQLRSQADDRIRASSADKNRRALATEREQKHANHDRSRSGMLVWSGPRNDSELRAWMPRHLDRVLQKRSP